MLNLNKGLIRIATAKEEANNYKYKLKRSVKTVAVDIKLNVNTTYLRINSYTLQSALKRRVRDTYIYHYIMIIENAIHAYL